MKVIFAFGLIMLVQISYAQLRNVVDVIIPPVYLGNRWDDFCFANDSVGFVVTSEGFIYKTTNSFSTIAHKARFQGYGRSIAFLDDKVGFYGGIDVYDNGNLYQTTDGGSTWNVIVMDLVANDTTPGHFPYGVCGLRKADTTVYACGAYYGRPYVARYNGVNQPWDYINMDAQARGLVDMYWINERKGFVTGGSVDLSEGGTILYTEDAGSTWTRVFTSGVPMDFVWKLFPLNDSIIYAGIQSYAPHSARMAKSTDGGMTWTQYLVDSSFVSLQGIGFVNEQEGYIGGHFLGYYSTKDGGNNWQFVNDSSVGSLNRFVRHKNKLFVSGARIYSVTDSNYVGIENLKQQPTTEVSIKLYPNPTSGSFALEIDLSNITNAHLIIYDAAGKVLDQIPHQKWQSGKHTLNFDSSLYPAGTYYIGFITDHGNWFETLMVTK